METETDPILDAAIRFEIVQSSTAVPAFLPFTPLPAAWAGRRVCISLELHPGETVPVGGQQDLGLPF